MSATCAAVLLAILGGLLEIAGVSLVIKEIRSDRRKARELFPPEKAEEVPGAETHELSHSADALLAKEQSLEERVDSHDMKYALLEATGRATKAEMQQRIDEAALEVAEQDAERDLALRRFLEGQLTGSISTRIWGVALILLGVLATTAAGVWGLFIQQ